MIINNRVGVSNQTRESWLNGLVGTWAKNALEVYVFIAHASIVHYSVKLFNAQVSSPE